MRLSSVHLQLLDAAVPVAVGVVVVAGAILHGGSVDPLALAVGLAAAASLAGRRRAPGWTLAVSGALALLMLHLDSTAAPAVVLAPAVALYSLALRRGRTEQLVAAVGAVGAVVAVELLSAERPTLLQTVGHVLLVAIPLLAAEAHRTQRANMALLRERLELAERTREREAERRAAQERMRIARDLHDVVAHTLTTINVQASSAAELLEHDPEHARSALATISNASREAIGELRGILGVLRTGDSGEAPLAPAPGLAALESLIAGSRTAGLDVELAVDGEPPARLPDGVALAAYRIVQESLTNARRHAAGAPVRVRLAFEPSGLTLAVENGDGGRGSDNGSTPGVGILGMGERAAAIGGTLRAAPVADGFRVVASLPYAPAGE